MNNFSHAYQIAAAVNAGELSAVSLCEQFLSRIDTLNPNLNAYTLISRERALAKAAEVDQKIASGETAGALAGVPFAVKNLFDIKNEVTLAGSKINAKNQPANNDATLIQQLEGAGAILLGALNMGEYAYDFTGENAHHGNCQNPWRKDLMSGGSSSGSGSATAAGIAPLSLGSDTNGSIRVPSSLCGIFGLKPSYGRLSRGGTFPFVDSLDHLGPMARSVKDLALAFDIMQGDDPRDHALAKTPYLSTVDQLTGTIDELRFAKLSGYFDTRQFASADSALKRVCQTLNCSEQTELPLVEAGRAAAYLITNIEGATLHLPRLQNAMQDFDPDTRDRFIAGTMLPAHWYTQAQAVRLRYRDAVLKVFEHYDVLLAPATPCTAPAMGQKWLTLGDKQVPLRPNLGYFTQPISAIGLPSAVVPCIDTETGLPIGVQIIAAPWREDICLRVAYYLEQHGFAALAPSGLINGEFDD